MGGNEKTPGFFLGFFIACLSLQTPFAAVAQDYPTSEQFLVIATINRERLFSDSLFGKSFNQSFQQDTLRLAEENRRIEKELIREENDLTQKRKQLSNDAFRKLAAVFNDKVEVIRRDQAQKLNKLNASRIQAQRLFFRQIQPVIVEFMQERGIQFILNDQAIFISASSGDITNSVIERIDTVLGAGLPRDNTATQPLE